MSKELVERCIQKDEAAWSEFIKKFKHVVDLSIRKKLTHLKFNFNSEDVKDISQDVFSEIWNKNKLSLLEEKEKILSWLCIVAQNAAIDFIRSKAVINKRVVSSLDVEEGLDAFDAIASKALSPADQAENNELEVIVDEFLSSLKDQDRLILSLNLYYDKSHIEVSKILDISINTVSTIIRRSKENLKKILLEKGYKNY